MIYTEVDIENTDDGDLIIENGDLKLATASRSLLQAAMFVVLTDYGDYTPDPFIAGNLGSFIGATNSTQTRSKMRSSVVFGLQQQNYVQVDQISVSVTPLDINEALVSLRMPLIFQEKDPADQLTEPLIVGFIFPFLPDGGTLERIEI